MDTVYILQVVTICLTALSLLVNVVVTLRTSKQENYNNIITTSRLNFMNQNRNNAAQFVSEAKSIALMLKCKKKDIDLKPLYYAFTQISIALKSYNSIDKDILDAGNNVVTLIEQSISNGSLDETLSAQIEEFSRLINIYDDADWKFIKQQYNSSNKKSEEFDKICDNVITKYR